MRFVNMRFNGSLLAELDRLQDRRARFSALLADRPTGIRVSTRTKNPRADLKLQYGRVFFASTALAAVLHGIGIIALPTYEVRPAPARMDQIVITAEEIPETRQLNRPPPAPRPAVPLEAEVDEVPEDVTIATTDLEFERVPLDLPAPPSFTRSSGQLPEEEEALELWLAVNTQWRVGMSLVGLDYNVLFKMADRLEIDLSPCVMKKIRRLEIHTIANQGKSDAERDGQGSDKTQKRFKGRK